MANFAPEYKVMGVPYLFRDKEHLFKVLEGETGEKLLLSGSDYLLRGLCFYDAGSRSFYTKDKPIKTPADLDGLKIRVMNHQMSVDMVNQMGGSATPMAYGELYTALQQGVVDGAENNPPSFVTSRHYEVCKYYTLDEHSSIPDVLVIGTKYWKTLSLEEQTWMKEAANFSSKAQQGFWKKNVEECMVTLKAANVEIFKPEKSLFAKKSKAVLDGFVKDPKMKKIIDEIKAQYGDDRRSEIIEDAYDLSIEDLITPQDLVVTISNTGYIKAQVLDEYRAQRRGGRGKQAMTAKEDDFIEQMFVANTHDNILCFSSRGQVYWLKVYEVPQGSRVSKGKPIVNLFPLMPGEKINATLVVKDFVDDKFIFMATSKGTVKKTPLSDFSNPRKNGIIAIKLDNGDYLIGAEITNGENDIVLVSNGGKAVWFDENGVRSMGRNARGVRGMKIPDENQALSLLIASSEDESVLVATENGYGKRTVLSDFRKSGRGTQGVKAIQVSDRNGIVVAARLVGDSDEIMLITTGGVLIRTRVSEIRELGRATQGVTLINLTKDEKLSGLAKIVEPEQIEMNQDELPI
jgi:tripartite ATP-independent transporter DctP family solute receptor